MDLYYDSEKPLNPDIKILCRKIIATIEQEVTGVEQVLNEFFVLTEQGYINNRCDSVINEYKRSIHNKSKAGKASAESRKSKKTKANPTPVQQPNNRCPTGVRNHKPKPKPITSREDNNSLSGGIDTFAMTEDWQPGENFTEKIKSLFIKPESFTPQMLAEFVGYWSGYPGRGHSQAQWEHKLAQSIKKQSLEGASNETTRRLSAQERKSERLKSVYDYAKATDF